MYIYIYNINHIIITGDLPILMNQNDPRVVTSLRGPRSDDLSAPTLGWQAYTAPEPVPVIRYYTQVSAARTFKERGNRAFHQRQWKDAESWYSQALKCGMDEEKGAIYQTKIPYVSGFDCSKVIQSFSLRFYIPTVGSERTPVTAAPDHRNIPKLMRCCTQIGQRCEWNCKTSAVLRMMVTRPWSIWNRWQRCRVWTKKRKLSAGLHIWPKLRGSQSGIFSC